MARRDIISEMYDPSDWGDDEVDTRRSKRDRKEARRQARRERELQEEENVSGAE